MFDFTVSELLYYGFLVVASFTIAWIIMEKILDPKKKCCAKGQHANFWQLLRDHADDRLIRFSTHPIRFSLIVLLVLSILVLLSWPADYVQIDAAWIKGELTFLALAFALMVGQLFLMLIDHRG